LKYMRCHEKPQSGDSPATTFATGSAALLNIRYLGSRNRAALPELLAN
jgi:hypothetical protein